MRVDRRSPCDAATAFAVDFGGRGKQFLYGWKIRNVRLRRHLLFKLFPYADGERMPVFLFEVIDERRNTAVDMAMRVDASERRFRLSAQDVPGGQRTQQPQHFSSVHECAPQNAPPRFVALQPPGREAAGGFVSSPSKPGRNRL